MPDYTAARVNMVESQIKTNKVSDPRVQEAFLTVPREEFVPKSARGIAYVDEDIAIGNGRYLMEPMVLARLVQSADVAAEDLVLVIGANTGYSSAIMAHLATTIVTLEQDPELAKLAEHNLSQLGVDNAVVIEGDLTRGYPAQGPYDVILINGSVAEVPVAIFDQLAEGGRMTCVISGDGHLGRATLYQKLQGVVSSRVLFDASAPWLPGFERKPSFVF